MSEEDDILIHLVTDIIFDGDRLSVLSFRGISFKTFLLKVC